MFSKNDRVVHASYGIGTVIAMPNKPGETFPVLGAPPAGFVKVLFDSPNVVGSPEVPEIELSLIES